MMCFGIWLDEASAGIKSETLSTFLASSLNVELVYIILKGIKKLSSYQEQKVKEEGGASILNDPQRQTTQS